MVDYADNRETCFVVPLVMHVTNGPEAGRKIVIRNLPMMIGRGGRSRCPLKDLDDPPSISREHATLSLHAGKIAITDHSINGTRVNTYWLNHKETCYVNPGDSIGLGPTLILQLQQITATNTHSLQATSSIIQPGLTEQQKLFPKSLKEFITNPEILFEAWHRVELNHGAAGPDWGPGRRCESS